jgi:hypothetical protein
MNRNEVGWKEFWEAFFGGRKVHAVTWSWKRGKLVGTAYCGSKWRHASLDPMSIDCKRCKQKLP